MHWEVEVRPKMQDHEQTRVQDELRLLTHKGADLIPVRGTSRGYLLPGTLVRQEVERLTRELLVDPIAETGFIREIGGKEQASSNGRSPDSPAAVADVLTVLLKPGVMNPAALSVVEAGRDLGVEVSWVQTFRRYYLSAAAKSASAAAALHKVIANEAIEQVIAGAVESEHLATGRAYEFHLIVVPIRELGTTHLEQLSKSGQLALNAAEMQAIQQHFRQIGRDPTDVELETLAQTWSEHCSHKTLRGTIVFNGRRIENLLGETIFGATREIRRQLGARDWCVSVFEDNAGVVRFDEQYNVCFKVETHNHPSAIEPYGGANTGVGGVIRDPLGTGLGAWPVCNTDVFCFAPPDTTVAELPPGVFHPLRVMKGVVAGVRDYGNRMGIPTVNGAICFDSRYLGNPLVYCGTVGLIPIDRCKKGAQPGDLIVVVGGRTGRDGIHGATFSSLDLHAGSESVSSGAVQIGNAITEKKLLDVIIQARDRDLYHAITDCGAGGFSSAVGEMGAELGAEVHLERVPLKYAGLSYAEIWISESQERMMLAVPPANWETLQGLAAGEGVEATTIGTFEGTGRLRLHYNGHRVADLDMHFLHRGRPTAVREARWTEPLVEKTALAADPEPGQADYTSDLLKILGSYNVCSKETVIRQYDHEVQGGTVLKPLVGAAEDGPGDAAVVTPVLGSTVGLAIACGINPLYGDLDPYWMAIAAVDEAARNVVAVGADPARVALLDNFCWGNTDRPETLGSLVRAAEGCRDAAVAYSMPFISGKDSLYNEYRTGASHIAIPGTLLISALARVSDVRRCVTMDFKEPGNRLYVLGETREELGGSHFFLTRGCHGGAVPQTDLRRGRLTLALVHQAIEQGLVRACHDMSEGGLAVAVAEMAFAGGIGAEVIRPDLGAVSDAAWLFAESTSRFVVEVRSTESGAFEQLLGQQVPWQAIGRTLADPWLRIASASRNWLVRAPLDTLKEAWQKPLRW